MLTANAKTPLTFTPPVGKAIRLSSASLAHNAKSTARASLLISCPSTSPDSTATPITVSTLTSAAHPSTLLDLYLLGGQEVALQAKGDGDIHVGGYCTVQDIGEEDDDDEYDEGEGEGYLIDENHVDEYGQEGEEDEEDEDGGRWMVPGALKRRAAKTQAARSIIDELREDYGEDGADDLDDSDFIGELLEGDEEEDDDEDDDDDDDDDDDAEMYEFGEEDENEATNEELADAIRQQLAGKIRVIETDEEDSEDEKEATKAKKPQANKTAGKQTAATQAKATSKPAKPAAPTTPSQHNGTTAAAKKRAAEEQKTPATANTASKKQKTAAAAAVPSTPHTAGSAAGSTKTVKCAHCSKLFSTELAVQQHAEIKHKGA